MTPIRPTYILEWTPSLGTYVASVAEDAIPPDMPVVVGSDPDPIRALGECREEARRWLAGVLDDEPVSEFADDRNVVCPVHMRHAPCTELHYGRDRAEPPYTTNSAVVRAVLSRSEDESVDDLLADLYERRQRQEVSDVLAGLARGQTVRIGWDNRRATWLANSVHEGEELVGEGVDALLAVQHLGAVLRKAHPSKPEQSNDGRSP